MPNRRESLTYKIVLQAYDNLQVVKGPIDSLPQVLFDWMVLGMVTGFGKSEWCQSRLTSPGQDIGRNIDGSARAFIRQDFIFENLHGVRMDNFRQASIL